MDNLGPLTIELLPKYFPATLDLLERSLTDMSIADDMLQSAKSTQLNSVASESSSNRKKQKRSDHSDDRVADTDADHDQHTVSASQKAADMAVAAFSVVLVAVRRLPSFVSPFAARILKNAFHSHVVGAPALNASASDVAVAKDSAAFGEDVMDVLDRAASSMQAGSESKAMDVMPNGAVAAGPAAKARASTTSASSSSVATSHRELQHVVDGLFASMTAHVPARLLLPALFQSFPHVLSQSLYLGKAAAEDAKEEAKEHAAHPAPVIRLFQFLGSLCAHVSLDEVETHYPALFKFVLAGLDLRRRVHDQSGPSVVSEASLRAIEDAVCTCFVALVLRLSEAQLKPVFLKLVSWLGFAGTLSFSRV